MAPGRKPGHDVVLVIALSRWSFRIPDRHAVIVVAIVVGTRRSRTGHDVFRNGAAAPLATLAHQNPSLSAMP